MAMPLPRDTYQRLFPEPLDRKDDVERLTIDSAIDQKGYWENPLSVAMHWNGIQAADDEYVFPDWMDRDALKLAHDYYKEANQGSDWWDWQELDVDDPFRSVLRAMPEPPEGEKYNVAPYRMKYDFMMGGLKDYQAKEEVETEAPAVGEGGMVPGTELPYPSVAMMIDPSQWDENVPDWQRVMAGVMSNPITHGSMTMIPWAILGAGTGFAAGNVPGAVVGAMMPLVMGAGMGLFGDPNTYEKLMKYGVPEPIAQGLSGLSVNAMLLMNVLSETFEKSLGFFAQAAEDLGEDNKLDKILESIPATWEVGAVAYDVSGGTFTPVANLAAGVEWLVDMVMRGESDVRFAKTGQVHILGKAEPVTLDAVGMAVLNIARNEIISGKPPIEVLNKIREDFGYSGQITDLAGQIILDPLNVLPHVGRKGIQKYAKYANNPALEWAAKNARGEGVLGTMRVYGDMLRTQAIPGTPSPLQMTRFQLRLAGLTPEGLIKELTPQPVGMRGFERIALQPFSPMAWVRTLRDLTPGSRARAQMGLSHETVGVLLDMAKGDRAEMFKIMHSIIDGSPLEASGVADLYGIPEIATVRQALADFAPELKKFEDADRLGEPQRNLLLTISKELNEQPANVLKMLRSKKAKDPQIIYDALKEKILTRGAQAAGVLDDPKFTPRKLAAMVRFFDENPWHTQDLRGRIHNKLIDHVMKWSEKAYGVGPDPKLVRYAASLKSVQSLLVLGFNPKYYVNNVVNNPVSRASMGVFGFAGQAEINKFFKDFGIEPSRLRAGVGAADIGFDVDATTAAGVKATDAFEQGGLFDVERLGIAEAENTLRHATRASDTTQGLQDLAGTLSRYGIISKLAQGNERAESSRAMYYGVKDAWGRLWNRDGGMPDLRNSEFRGLANELDRIDPRLVDVVHTTLERMKGQEEVGKFFEELVGVVNERSIDPYLPDIAETMGLEYGDMKALFDQSGIIEAINKRLARGDSIEEAFNAAESDVRKFIDETRKQDLITRAQEVEAKIYAEGAVVLLDLMVDMYAKDLELRTREFATWNKLFDFLEEHNVKYPERGVYMEARAAEADADWQSHKKWRRTTTVGMLRGMGFGDPNGNMKLNPDARTYVKIMRKLDKSWDGFYEKKAGLIREHIERTKDLQFTKADKQARWGSWLQVLEDLMKLYDEHSNIENNLTDQMANHWLQMMTKRFGADRIVGAAEWWNGVIRAQKKRQALMADFRMWEKGAYTDQLKMPEVIKLVEGRHPSERHAVWLPFLMEAYLPIIGETVQSGMDGAYKMYEDLTGVRYEGEKVKVTPGEDFVKAKEEAEPASKEGMLKEPEAKPKPEPKVEEPEVEKVEEPEEPTIPEEFEVTDETFKDVEEGIVLTDEWQEVPDDLTDIPPGAEIMLGEDLHGNRRQLVRKKQSKPSEMRPDVKGDKAFESLPDDAKEAVETFKDVTEIEADLERMEKESSPEGIDEPVEYTGVEFYTKDLGVWRTSDNYYMYKALEAEGGFIEIKGKKVEVPGFEEFDWFIHHTVYKISPLEYGKDWNISEGITGQAIVSGKRTQKEAISFAVERMERGDIDAAKVREVIRGHVEKYGVSPRYERIAGFEPESAKTPVENIPVPEKPGFDVASKDRMLQEPDKPVLGAEGRPEPEFYPFTNTEERVRALVEVFKYSEEAANIEVAILEVVAENWARRNNDTPDKFWKDFVGIQKGGEPGEGVFQRTGVDVAAKDVDALRARGAYLTDLDQNRMIQALEGADVDTFIHESFHYFFDYVLTGKERDLLTGRAETDPNYQGTRVGASEYGADNYVRYRTEGVTRNPRLKVMFDQFRLFMVDVMERIRKVFNLPDAWLPGSEVMPDQVRTIYDNMFDLLPYERTDAEWLATVRERDPVLYDSAGEAFLLKTHKNDVFLALQDGKRVPADVMVEHLDFEARFQDEFKELGIGIIDHAATMGDEAMEVPPAFEFKPAEKVFERIEEIIRGYIQPELDQVLDAVDTKTYGYTYDFPEFDNIREFRGWVEGEIADVVKDLGERDPGLSKDVVGVYEEGLKRVEGLQRKIDYETGRQAAFTLEDTKPKEIESARKVLDDIKGEPAEVVGEVTGKDAIDQAPIDYPTDVKITERWEGKVGEKDKVLHTSIGDFEFIKEGAFKTVYGSAEHPDIVIKMSVTDAPIKEFLLIKKYAESDLFPEVHGVGKTDDGRYYSVVERVKVFEERGMGTAFIAYDFEKTLDQGIVEGIAEKRRLHERFGSGEFDEGVARAELEADISRHRQDPFDKMFVEKYKEYEKILGSGDLADLANWGMTKDGRLVVLDAFDWKTRDIEKNLNKKLEVLDEAVVDMEYRDQDFMANIADRLRGRREGDVKYLEAFEAIKTSKEFEKLAREAGFDLDNEIELNMAYDLLEGGYNLHLRRERNRMRELELPLTRRLVELDAVERGMAKARRTIAKSELQQFSTPFTIAEAAAHAADVRPGSIVLEPTAGTGNLVEPVKVYQGDSVTIHVNEIDGGRQQVLELLGYKTSGIDVMGKDWVIGNDGRTLGPMADVIIANPPWGSYSTGKYGKPIHTPVQLNDWSQRFVALIDRRLAKGGRFVGVLPTNWLFTESRKTGEITLKKSEFYKWIDDNYWVRAVIESPPKAYDQRATGVGSLLIVYDKVPKPTDFTGTITKGIEPILKYGDSAPGTWLAYGRIVNNLGRGEIDGTHFRAAEHIEMGRNDIRPTADFDPERPATGPDSTGLADPAAGRGEPIGDPADIGTITEPEPGPVEGDLQGTDAVRRADELARGVVSESEPGLEAGDRIERPGAERGADTGVVEEGAERVRKPGERKSIEYSKEFRDKLDDAEKAISDSRSFTGYVPRSDIRDVVVHTHPRPLVEAKALAGVDAPPLLPEHQPSNSVMDAMGHRRLSQEGNIEPIWAAIQQNEKNNAGILISDDVGVGKARTAAGFVIDRIEKGKKRILVVTKNKQNINNLMDTEFPGVWGGRANEFGMWTDIPDDFPAHRVALSGTNFPEVKKGAEPAPTFDDAAVYFVSDSEFAKFGTAIKNLGVDVVIVDEVHSFKNGDSQKGGIWYDLHKDWVREDVDFMYLSATPGTDVAELRYLYGLKLWSMDGFDDWLGIITGKESADAVKARQESTVRLQDYIETMNAAREGVQKVEARVLEGTYKETDGYRVGEFEVYFDDGYWKEWVIGHRGDRIAVAASETEVLVLAELMRRQGNTDINSARDTFAELYPAPDSADIKNVNLTDASDVMTVAEKGGTSFGKRLSRFERTLPPAHTEQIMRELKQSGHYMSRDISREGVEFNVVEVPPTPAEIEGFNNRVDLYRSIYKAWIRFGAFNEGPKKYGALFGINGDLQADAKRSLFDTRLPHIIKEAQDALTRGEKVVISTISVSDVEGGGRLLENAISKINTNEVRKTGAGEYTDPTEIPEALIAVAELREGLAELTDMRSPIDTLQEIFGDRFKTIIGKDSAKARLETVKAFQSDKVDVVLISQAGKTGINLHDITGKKKVHLIVGDYEWRATNFKQELGRVDRTGQQSSPIISVLHLGSAGESRFVSQISNEMIGLGATSKGGAESTGVGALTDRFELGTMLDQVALQEGWSSMSLQERGMFLDRYFADPQTPGMPRTTLPQSGDAIRKFTMAMQTMRFDEGNSIYKNFDDARQILMSSEAAVQTQAERTASMVGEIIRTTDLEENLKLIEVRNTKNERFGIVTGTLTPKMNRLRNSMITQADSYALASGQLGNAWMQWVQFYDPSSGQYISGLKVRPGTIKAVAESFGQAAGGGWKPETAFIDMKAGDKIPIRGHEQADWNIYIGKAGAREGKIVVEGAKMKNKDVLMNNGAAYNAVGSFWTVPEAKLQEFIRRFPIEDVDPVKPSTLYQKAPDGTLHATREAVKYSQHKIPDEVSVMPLSEPIENNIGDKIVGMAFQDGEFRAFITEKFAIGKKFDVAGGDARLLGIDKTGENWVFVLDGEIKTQARDVEIPDLDPAGPVALGTLDSVAGVRYDSQIMEDGHQNWIRPALEDAKYRMMEDDGKPFLGADGELANLSADGQKELQRYFGEVSTGMAKSKLGAIRLGESKRDLALLNYSRRTGFDQVAGVGVPYHFWYTHQGINWAMRVMDRPALLAWYTKLASFTDREDYEKNMMASRLQGKWRIPAPFLPEWAGGGTYVDPLGKLFPLTEFMRPIDRYMQENTRITKAAEYAIISMIRGGQVEEAIGKEAIETRSGALWDRAMNMAQSEEGGDWMDYMSLFASPAMYLQIPYKLATGKAHEVTPMPLSRNLQALATVTGMDVFRTLDFEGNLRKKAGLNEFGEWQDYFIDRQLSNIAVSNPGAINEILMNMIDRSGPYYEEAMNRVRFEMAIREPGMSTLYSVFRKKDMGDVLGSMIFGWLPAHLMPEAELEQRGLKTAYNEAWAKYHEGDKEAVDTFFNDNPEYKARLALFDEPEERLRQFLISEVWDSYYELPELHRRQAREQLGEVFQTQFINKETRDYESLSHETLAHWANQMGGTVPEKVKTPQGELDYAPESTAKAFQRFVKERDQRFPEIFKIQEAYFNAPEEVQEQINSQTNLQEYWAWKDTQLANNPDLIPYLTSEESRLFGVPQEVAETVYRYRAERHRLFPDIFDIQDDYYDIDNYADKKSFQAAHPELEDYWEWQRTVFAQFPEIIPHVRAVETIARDVLGKDYKEKYNVGEGDVDLSQISPPLVRQMQGYYYGEELTGGAVSELVRLWEDAGEPGEDFETWLDGLGMLFKQGTNVQDQYQYQMTQ